MRNALRLVALSLLFAAPLMGEVTNAFVAKFYPASLATELGNPVPQSDRAVVFTVDTLTKSGTPLVVAVFTNHLRAAVSVISPAGEGAVVGTIAPDGMGGSAPEIDLIDFDATGNKEVVVR